MAYFEIFLQNYAFYLKYCITVKKKKSFFQKTFERDYFFKSPTSKAKQTTIISTIKTHDIQAAVIRNNCIYSYELAMG
jgi:hypothetical protein